MASQQQQYRFVGSQAAIGAHSLDTLGQSIYLDPAVAEPAIATNFPLLPEEQFAAIGFTDEELDEYSTPAFQEQAPTEFQAKLTAARSALHDFRESLRAKLQQ